MTIRRERVVLELEDQFTAGLARAAAASKMLQKELDSLDGKVVVIEKGMQRTSSGIDKAGKSSNRTSSDIDKLSGRMRILADVAAALGPALIPISGLAVPAISGLAAATGFAAVGAGTMVVAFQGVGDALKAVNTLALEPTAENLEKARDAMANLSPEAREMVKQLQDMRPAMRALRDAAADGMFPGLVQGLEEFEDVLPRIERIMSAVGGELGDIFADTGASFASDRWTPFFEFIADEAPSALADLARAIGNTTHAGAELWMAFDPVNDDFLNWLNDATYRLDQWASGLDQTDGFQEFIDYLNETAPQAGETLGSIGTALLEIVEAAAPLGGPVLQVLETFADLIATLADSPIGTPLMAVVTTLGAMNTALRMTSALNAKTFGGPAGAMLQRYSGQLLSVTTAQERAATTAGRLTQSQATSRAALLKGGAALAGFSVLASGAADGIGLTNTATLALAGSFAGAPGAAIGAAVGFFLDMTGSANQARDAIDQVKSAWEAAGTVADQDKIIEGVKKRIADLNEERLGWSGLSFSGSDLEELTALEKKLKELKAERGDGNFTKAAHEEARALGYASAEARAYIEAINALRDARGRAANADLNYEQAQLDVAAAVKENGRVVDAAGNALKGHEQAAIDSRRTLLGMKDAWNELNAKAGQTPAQQQAAKRAFVEAAEAMGYGHREARELANQLYNMPDANPEVKLAGEAAAAAAIERLRRKLKGIPDEIVNVIITETHRDGARGGQKGVIGGSPSKAEPMAGDKEGSADGSTVPKDGGPYADRYAYLLAPGEEVISNRHGQADRHRGLLKAINANQLADGGTVDAYRRQMAAYAQPVRGSSDSALIGELRSLRHDMRTALADRGQMTAAPAPAGRHGRAVIQIGEQEFNAYVLNIVGGL